jgi:ribonuclease P protein component
MVSGTGWRRGRAERSSRLDDARVASACRPELVGIEARGRVGVARLVGRVRDRESFERLLRSRWRATVGPVTVTWVEHAGEPALRVAYAVGRKLGGAVQRNRVRRRMREIVAGLAPELRGGTYLVSARAGAEALSFEELRRVVAEALCRAAGRETGQVR